MSTQFPFNKQSVKKTMLQDGQIVPDHEFPWIERENHYLYCTRCGESGDTFWWINFVEEHSNCKKYTPE